MTGESPTYDELKQALALTPDDLGLLRQIIDVHLSKGDTAGAAEYVYAALKIAPDQQWVLTAGLQVADTTGDRLRAARFRKQLRNVRFDDDDDFDDDDEDEEDDDWTLGAHPFHVSHVSSSNAASSRSDRSRFRLIAGGPASTKTPAWREPTFRLDDIAGLATVKRNLEEIINTLKSGDDSEQSWPGGTLFYGPPSCGKAFCGEVVATELDATLWFFDLADDWNDKTFGEMLRKGLDESLNSRVVLYFDNLDHKHSAVMHGAIDAIEASCASGNLAVLGAATFPWSVSTDIVRADRLGRVLLLLPPDAPARKIFLHEHFDDLIEITESDVDWLVEHTEGHSFGDLAHLVGTAMAIASSAGPIGAKVVLDHNSVRRARQQVGASSADWLTTAGHHALMNESAGLYDDLIQYFRSRQKT